MTTCRRHPSPIWCGMGRRVSFDIRCVCAFGQVLELSEQLTQFQERLLDQTEELQHANTQLEMLKRERDRLTDEILSIANQRDQLQVPTTQQSRQFVSSLACTTTSV